MSKNSSFVLLIDEVKYLRSCDIEKSVCNAIINLAVALYLSEDTYCDKDLSDWAMQQISAE